VSHPTGDRARAACHLSTPSGTGATFEFTLAFGTDTLPHVQLWRDLRPNVGVLALEPCTSERGTEGTSGSERLLMPSDRRRYSLCLEFAGSPLTTRAITGARGGMG
jgi:hypothetical protein